MSSNDTVNDTAATAAFAAVTLDNVDSVVRDLVFRTPAIDLHTHLFPPSHEELFSSGPNDLLTYHYLIAELFTVVDRDIITPEQFFALSKTQQADVVWEELFVKRSPISEARRGVLNTWNLLGLSSHVAARDLNAIRQWYSQLSPTELVSKIFELANVKYCYMTNIPFDITERKYWSSGASIMTDSEANRFRTCLRVDPLIENFDHVRNLMQQDGFESDVAGIWKYLDVWKGILKPAYIMLSLAFDFQFPKNVPGSLDMMKDVILPYAVQTGLPVFLKCGTRRGVNPRLKSGGDHVGVADVGVIQRMCQSFPNVKFVATFLSRVNQHELVVLARKFPNLHIYGCWWFLNNPSIIDEITRMRLELLGTSFTMNHSDCRVLDQLLYKWTHTREILTRVLVEKYRDLLLTSWAVTASEIERDVSTLFGGSFLEFMEKNLP